MINLTLALLLTLTTAAPTKSSPAGATHTARQKIRVYPTPHRPGNLTIESKAHESLWFYLFDLEGNLVCQLPVSGNQQKIIEGLASGTYTYHAFCHDRKLTGGKINISH